MVISRESSAAMSLWKSKDPRAMLLLLDIGNTNTHVGIANERAVLRQMNIPTDGWFNGSAEAPLRRFLHTHHVKAAALCSVVPRATRQAVSKIKKLWQIDCLILGPQTVRGVGIDYPKPQTIGPDRLANAAAVKHRFGAPAVVVDFGTAVTFDVVNRALTDYLHEKTALLPRIKIREIRKVIGKSTEEAMLIGAVHGYRGLIRELLQQLRRELKARSLPVVATGGYAKLMAGGLPEITAVDPLLTREGLRVIWQANQKP